MRVRNVLDPTGIALAGLVLIGAAACPSQTTGENDREPADAIQLPEQRGTGTSGTGTSGTGTSGTGTSRTGTRAPGTRVPGTATISAGPGAGAGIEGASIEREKDGTRFRLDIVSLHRGDGGLVTMKTRMSHISGPRFVVGGNTVGQGAYLDSSLIDPVGQKKYMMVTDSENKCLCSKFGYEMLDVGEPIELHLTFPPVPTSVTHVTVNFADFAPIEHVAIS
jgi:hypothetical protein